MSERRLLKNLAELRYELNRQNKITEKFLESVDAYQIALSNEKGSFINQLDAGHTVA